MIADESPTPERAARWRAAFAEHAAEYWTAERTAELAAGKALVLPPVESASLLRAMGLLHRDASMPPRQIRKYWQVSHMVTLLASQVRALLAAHDEVLLVDAGCGRSYLSMALAHVARLRWGGRLLVLGIDRNAEVLQACRLRSQLAELGEVMTFRAGALGAPARELLGDRRAHAVLALHACDTATCDALALGVELGAELIAVAPCCQAELARGWSARAEAPPGEGGPEAFRSIWATPHLRRETAADLTDAMRALLLRARGYQVRAIEFVPAEHTRKNTLLRAERAPTSDREQRAAALAEYRALVTATGGVGLALEARLAALPGSSATQ